MGSAGAVNDYHSRVKTLEELADEAKWDEAFAVSADKLEKLAAEALEEYRAALRPRLGGCKRLRANRSTTRCA